MNSSSYPVSDLILRDQAAIDRASVSAEASVGDLAALHGHFALHLETPSGGHLLVRDPMGVNKLFFAVDQDGSVRSSNFFIDLVRAGHAARDIWSVPSGHAVRVTPSRQELTLEKYSQIRFADDDPAEDADLPVHARRIRDGLNTTFQILKRVLADRNVYVTLSGGLDSSTIAALAQQHIGNIRGVTFAVSGEAKEVQQSGDLYYARKVADELGIPLEVVEVAPSDLERLLDDVLIYGQDFRDFNVHCALVNAALGRFIQTQHGGPERPVVLTGDTMNELVADYTPVSYASAQYYSLPNLPTHKLRRFLVQGLDTGDREVGVFARFGIDTIEPYALYPELYTTLPGRFLSVESAKQRLSRLVMGDDVPSFIYDRPKVRAQVGNSEKVGGTLAALVDAGVDSAELDRRFCALSGFTPADLKGWIRAGMYRFPTNYPKRA